MQQTLFEHGCFYHVFNRGNNKEDIFSTPQDYVHFLSLMKKYLLPVVNVYAYCLLKNHFHLLVQIKESTEISKETWREKPHLGFSHLFNSYTQGTNKVRGRIGSLFQEHPKRIKITDEKYLLRLITYIHLNPIKHNFSEELTYSYSSYNAMLSDKASSIKRDEVLNLFDDIENFKYWHDLKSSRTKEIMNLTIEDI